MQKGRHGLYVTVAIFGSCGHSRQAQVICRQLWVQLAGTCSTSAVLDSADRRRQFWTQRADTGSFRYIRQTQALCGQLWTQQAGTGYMPAISDTSGRHIRQTHALCRQLRTLQADTGFVHSCGHSRHAQAGYGHIRLVEGTNKHGASVVGVGCTQTSVCYKKVGPVLRGQLYARHNQMRASCRGTVGSLF